MWKGAFLEAPMRRMQGTNGLASESSVLRLGWFVLWSVQAWLTARLSMASTSSSFECSCTFVGICCFATSLSTLVLLFVSLFRCRLVPPLWRGFPPHLLKVKHILSRWQSCSLVNTATYKVIHVDTMSTERGRNYSCGHTSLMWLRGEARNYNVEELRMLIPEGKEADTGPRATRSFISTRSWYFITWVTKHLFQYSLVNN